MDEGRVAVEDGEAFFGAVLGKDGFGFFVEVGVGIFGEAVAVSGVDFSGGDGFLFKCGE